MTTLSPASSSVDEKHAEEVKAPMAGLSDREREIIERQIDAPKLTVGYFALFRYYGDCGYCIDCCWGGYASYDGTYS
jgi:hypothetical protein